MSLYGPPVRLEQQVNPMCALCSIAGMSLAHPRKGSSLERSAAFSAASFMNCLDPTGCRVYSLISRMPSPCCCCWLLLLKACASSGSAALLVQLAARAPCSSGGQAAALIDCCMVLDGWENVRVWRRHPCEGGMKRCGSRAVGLWRLFKEVAALLP